MKLRLDFWFTFVLLSPFFFSNCQKKLNCENNIVEACIVNTRSSSLIGSLKGSFQVDTLYTNQRKCYSFPSTDIFTFEISAGKKYTWSILSCKDDYPVF